MVSLHCGDCLDILPTLAAGSVDAVITDPPYGIGYMPDWKKWDGSASDFVPIIGDTTPFDPGPFLEYPTVVLFGANHYSDRLPVGGWICWDKRLHEINDRMIGSPFELAWFKSSQTQATSIMVRTLHGGVINADSRFGNNEKRVHPTQKPVRVMKQIILRLTNPGDTVLDAFMGSGTTGVACVETGRNFIGIEREPDYYAIAEARIEKAAAALQQLEMAV